MLVDFLFGLLRSWLLNFIQRVLILIIILGIHMMAGLLNELVILILHG